MASLTMRLQGLNKINWSLWIGGLIVAGVIFVAFTGPELAPQDPMQENLIVQVSPGEWEIPPFTAFSVPGFPLGSDIFGRDMLSRILWAVQPTMQMVALVAVVRLLIGTLIGIAAGWSTGWLGRTLDGVISTALAVPVLMVALCAIAAVGIEWGVPAFVVGLSINGWGETARVVREQTRTVKSNEFITAARALGALDLHTIYRHVLRHILPLVWMLFALEISGTLVVTAGLGFLGYYIGGDVWIAVGDFVARRMSGMPELGQMLATSWARLNEPWPLVTTGSIVFLIVMGFNLLGDGLRRELQVITPQPETPWRKAWASFTDWLEERVLLPVFTFLSVPVVRPLLTIIVAGVLFWGGAQAWTTVNNAGVEFDEQGVAIVQPTPTPTLSPDQPTPTPSPTPVTPQTAVQPVISFESEVLPFLAQSTDGTLWVVRDGEPRQLVGVGANGAIVATRDIPGSLSGMPVLGPDDTLYIYDREGRLRAETLSGDLLWQLQSPSGRPGATQLVRADDGRLYFASGPDVLAVSPTGELLWATNYTTSLISSPIRSVPDGSLVFYGRDAFNAITGERLILEFPYPVDDFNVGLDGQLLARTVHSVTEWQLTDAGTAELGTTLSWNYQGVLSPTGLGPTNYYRLADGTTLLLYTYDFSFRSSYAVWLAPDGDLLRALRADEPTGMSTTWSEALPDGSVLLCGASSGGGVCRQVTVASDYPLWNTTMGSEAGAVMTAHYNSTTGQLLVLTEAGGVFALDTTQLSTP